MIPSQLLPAVILLLIAQAMTAQTQLVTLHSSQPSDLGTVQQAGFDVVATGEDIRLLLHDDDETRLLRSLGLGFSVEHQDLQAFYGERLSPDLPSDSGGGASGTGITGSMGGYPTWMEGLEFLDQLALRFPQILSPKFSIGTSFEGRTIWAWKLSDHHLIDEAEPEIVIDAMHHGREPMAFVTALAFVQQMVEGYGHDPEITHFVDHREIFIVPCINPDGYVYNEATNPGGGGLWRKNRRPLGLGEFGVDPNRNYGFEWGFDNIGSSPNPIDSTYRGTAPFTEPCVTAYRDFLLDRDATAVISLHAFGNVVGMPPGYQPGARPGNRTRPLYEALYNQLRAVSPSWRVSWLPELLPRSNGTLVDWVAGDLHGGDQAVACVVEIGTNIDGFWPSSTRRDLLTAEALNILRSIVREAGPRFEVETVVAHEPGGTTSETWEPGEALEFEVSVRNLGISPAESITLELLRGGMTIAGTAPVTLGPIPALGTGNNRAMRLPFSIPSAMRPGDWIDLSLRITSALTEPLHYPIPRPLSQSVVELYGTEFEASAGWTAGAPGDTATTPSAGAWERGVPVATTFPGLPGSWNPGEDATPGGGTKCWSTGIGPVGGSHTRNDVDGITTLLSPAFDLSNLVSARIEYARWFATTGFDDFLRVEVSTDGGQRWTVIDEVRVHTPRWVRKSISLSNLLGLTDRVRLRVRVQDDPNNGIVEAGFDDFRFTGSTNPLAIDAHNPAQDRLNVQLNAPAFAGDTFLIAVAGGVGSGFQTSAGTVPLVQDELFSASVISGPLFPTFMGTLDAAGSATASALLPVGLPQPVTVWVAAAVGDAVGLRACSGAHSFTVQ